jgi:hypothetical protein
MKYSTTLRWCSSIDFCPNSFHPSDRMSLYASCKKYW